jgi:hypothetical protein
MTTRNRFATVTLVTMLALIAAPAWSDDAGARPEVDSELMTAPAEPSLTEEPQVDPQASAPPECDASWRAVRLKCKPGAEGLVTGIYGGTDFFLICGDGTERICVSDNSFRYLMEGGVPGGPQVRCALSGDDVQVNEFCGPLHLIIN